MNKVKLFGHNQSWSYVNVEDDEAEKIADAFLKGETFSILINEKSSNPTYRAYFNSFQLVHVEIEYGSDS
jgi:hypothetical protein